MAIGWLTLLKTVPWSEVISNAPRVAEGAKKLWQSVGRKPGRGPTAAVKPPAAAGQDLAARVAAMEKNSAELHEQMLASSELLRALAEQQAQLVKRVERNRKLTLWLTVATAVALIAALAAVRIDFL